jgi:8-oxo-dGTP diphosphatase
VKTVTAAIIKKENKVLLTRRKPGEKLEGFWEFPGGKIEEDETPQECLRRELTEELGVVTDVLEQVAESIFSYDHGSIKLIALRTNIVSGNITLSVHDQVEWVKLNELLSYKLAPADIPIAEKIMELYKNV